MRRDPWQCIRRFQQLRRGVQAVCRGSTTIDGLNAEALGERLIFLKGILDKIKSDDVTDQEKEQCLIELGEAGQVCQVTGLNVAKKWYGKLHGQEETAEMKILRIIQEYKEQIILQFVQVELKKEWHALNYVRRLIGREIGLTDSTHEHDQFVDPASKYTYAPS